MDFQSRNGIVRVLPAGTGAREKGQIGADAPDRPRPPGLLENLPGRLAHHL